MKAYDQNVLLALIENGANTLILTDAAAVDYATAVTASLGTIALTAADFTVGAGDVSGRKITFNGVIESDAQTYSFTGGSANVQHASFYASGTGVRYAITDLAVAKAVNDGDIIEITALDLLELRDAV